MRKFTVSALAAIACLAAVPAYTADDAKPAAADKKDTAAAPAEPVAIKTKHQITIDGQVVKYTATVGWLIMKDDKDQPIARFGYTAYTRDGVANLATRPIMFAYNGGPGSSSIWLHMGIMGPRRVVATDAGYSPPPPYSRTDNAYSVLDLTDIVMVDPVGTGFSKPLGDTEGKVFWGVDQDMKSVSAFIKRYVTENGRWASPKYLLGESYGGMRTAAVANHLQSTMNMDLNGVVLVSPFLNAGSGIDGSGIDLPHALYFPTFAATAWYHNRLANKPASLPEYLAEVERFSFDEYLPALVQGYTLPADRKKAVAAKLAAYTGTTADYWEKADLRVSHPQFLQELMRNDRTIAGRIDSRFIGPSTNPLSESMDYDPFFPAVAPAYTGAFLDYLRSELNYTRDEAYVVSAFSLDWDWEHKAPGEQGWMEPFPNTVPDLSMAMTMNPGLRVLVLQGYYDLATPWAATRNDLAHLDIPADARKRITESYYDAGHMMYLHEASMRKWRSDVAGFIRAGNR